MALPLLVGAPGAMELLVVLLVSLLLFSPLVALAYVTLFRPDRVDESRLDDLETEVSRLRARLDEREATSNPRPDGADGATAPDDETTAPDDEAGVAEDGTGE